MSRSRPKNHGIISLKNALKVQWKLFIKANKGDKELSMLLTTGYFQCHNVQVLCSTTLQ